jgi:hypothetical protein
LNEIPHNQFTDYYVYFVEKLILDGTFVQFTPKKYLLATEIIFEIAQDFVLPVTQYPDIKNMGPIDCNHIN